MQEQVERETKMSISCGTSVKKLNDSTASLIETDLLIQSARRTLAQHARSKPPCCKVIWPVREHCNERADWRSAVTTWCNKSPEVRKGRHVLLNGTAGVGKSAVLEAVIEQTPPKRAPAYGR
ncbi:MAG: hypothetical protein R3F37_16645 [Candidatus Competibacteraceae bacterium]